MAGLVRTPTPATWQPMKPASAWHGNRRKQPSSAWELAGHLMPTSRKVPPNALPGNGCPQYLELVDTFFDQLDFRRFQVDMDESIEMDDTSQMPLLLTYGNILGEKIINDHYDRAMGIVAPKIKK